MLHSPAHAGSSAQAAQDAPIINTLPPCTRCTCCTCFSSGQPVQHVAERLWLHIQVLCALIVVLHDAWELCAAAHLLLSMLGLCVQQGRARGQHQSQVICTPRQCSTTPAHLHPTPGTHKGLERALLHGCTMACRWLALCCHHTAQQCCDHGATCAQPAQHLTMLLQPLATIAHGRALLPQLSPPPPPTHPPALPGTPANKTCGLLPEPSNTAQPPVKQALVWQQLQYRLCAETHTHMHSH